MQIAVIANAFPVLSETFILNQITGLIDLGHDVSIHAERTSEQPHGNVRHYDLHDRLRAIDMPQNKAVRVWDATNRLRQSTGDDRRFLRRTLNVARYGINAASLKLFYECRAMLGRSYDVLHCQYGPNGNRIAQLREIGLVTAPIVTTFHGYDIRLALKSRRDLYKHLKRHGDCFLAISRYSRGQLEKLGFDGERIIEHPVGIDVARFPPRHDRPRVDPIGDRPVRILTVGRMVWEKAHAVGIRAIHELLRRRPDWNVRFTIIGDGELRGELERLVRELGLEQIVEMPGAMDQPKVRTAMAEADLFLLSSVAEVLPTVLMEAQASGLPVVATKIAAVPEIVEDGQSGLLAEPNDSSALADALEQLILRSSDHAAMGRRGRAIVEERFDIDRLNRRLVEIYEGLRTRAEGNR